MIDSETHQPVPEVQVRRLTSDTSGRASDTPAGGRVLQEGSVVRTGKDGHFALPSVRNLGPLGGSGWSSVSLAFQRSGYQALVKSYSLAHATNAPSGEPVVDAGDVALSK